MRTGLNIAQRIMAVVIYLSVIVFLCRYFSGDWQFLSDSNSNYNLLFVSGALLLIFGTYIAEPYFTKPIDVITNSTAVILALLSIKQPSSLFGYWELYYVSLILGLSSILLIFLSQFPKFEKLQRAFFEIITKAGQSKILFSVIYLSTAISYFGDKPLQFVFFLTFWVVFVAQFIVESLIVWLTKIINFLFFVKASSEVIGEAIGCENPYLYTIEVDYFKHKIRDIKKGKLVYLALDEAKGAVGVVINEKQLLNKKWISVYLLELDNSPLKIDLKKHEFISGSNSIFTKDSAVYGLNLDDVKDLRARKIVMNNYLYKNISNFIGYVAEGSDISKIKFHSLLSSSREKNQLLKEGTVVKTQINNEDVLYQIIDGATHEKELEKHSVYGFVTAVGQKLGKYNWTNQELETAKWLPNIYTPVFFDESRKSMGNKLAIGRLPETNLEIILKDVNALVTHNTAILGILGIGKSYLTFELIKKIIDNTGAKIIIIDITNEYKRELPEYTDEKEIVNDLSEETITNLRANNKNGDSNNPKSWGNEELYKSLLDTELLAFSDDASKRTLILNPDWHPVSKAGSSFNITHKIDLTIAEKTRIISERLFMLARKKWDDSGEYNKDAKFLIVYEEAHSLVPEWNSTANPADQSASNGTAKVILQGRKYGLGSFVITQRTANISKSILNQCNTIFAMRVFDDTGKLFLENYIGSDYSNTLPTLEERHAIVVGKALKLKQPVIIRLNDKDEVIDGKRIKKDHPSKDIQ